MATARESIIRAPRSRALLWTLAMLWNAGGTMLGRQAPLFVLGGALAALFFGYFAARVLFGATTAAFDGADFRVSTGPLLPPFGRFHHPIADIHAFVADIDDDYEREGHAVFLVTRGSPKRFRLPLPLAGAQVHQRGAKKPLFSPVTRERATAVADELNGLLDDARHATSGYREVETVAPHVRIDASANRDEAARRHDDDDEDDPLKARTRSTTD
jgi:hypothetical protein